MPRSRREGRVRLILQFGRPNNKCVCEQPNGIHLGKGVWALLYDMDKKCPVKHPWRRDGENKGG